MTSIIKAFIVLQEVFARLPAMLLLAFYVVLVPIFAIYYDLRASEFYHSTAKYEKSVLLDGDRFRTDLEEAVRKQFIHANEGTTRTYKEWTIDIDDFSINSANFENGRLSFKAYMRFKSTAGVQTGGPKLFSVSIRPDMVVGFPDDPAQYVVKFPQSSREQAWPVPDREIFQNSANVIAPTGSLKISMALQNQITNLHNSFRGFPALSSGAFKRMLYFSAVTQTTLGYGDVVPITDRTRMAVALQTVLGIVVVGLFLNSLAGPKPRRR